MSTIFAIPPRRSGSREPDSAVSGTHASLPTNWSEIRVADQVGPQLNAVVSRYFRRIALRVANKWRYLSPDRVDDLVSGFAAKMLEGRVVRHANPNRGRFRDFLNRCVDNHVRDMLRRAKPPIEADEVDLDARATASESDSIWAEEVFRESTLRLEIRCREEQKPEIWALAKRHYIDPLLCGEGPPSLERSALELGLESANVVAGKLRTARLWMRQAASQLLREMSRQTDLDADQELSEYSHALSTRTGRMVLEKPPLGDLYSDLSSALEDFDPVRWRRIAGQCFLGTTVLCTFDDVLHCEMPPLAILEIIKEFAKQQMQSSCDGFETGTAKLLYSTSIAVAQVRCRTLISKLSVSDLMRRLEWVRDEVPLNDRYQTLIGGLLRELRSMSEHAKEMRRSNLPSPFSSRSALSQKGEGNAESSFQAPPS